MSSRNRFIKPVSLYMTEQAFAKATGTQDKELFKIRGAGRALSGGFLAAGRSLSLRKEGHSES